MKKLFYLASGIILCASFLPKEVNAKPIEITPDRGGELLSFKNKTKKNMAPIRLDRGGELLKPKEARAKIGSPAMKKKCKNKSNKYTYTLLRTRRSGVIGKKYGRVFRSSRDAEKFFENICMSSNPDRLMKKGF